MEQPGTPAQPTLARQKVIIALGITALLCILGAIAATNRPRARATPVLTSAPDEKPSPIAESQDPPKAKRVPSPAPAPPPKSTGEIQRARTGDYNSTDKGTDWSVVAATLNDWDAADRRAQSLRSQWRQCDCKVYPPRGQGEKYFVVLGMDLGRNDADRLRDAATAAGMPPDTYVTKLFRPSALAE